MSKPGNPSELQEIDIDIDSFSSADSSNVLVPSGAAVLKRDTVDTSELSTFYPAEPAKPAEEITEIPTEEQEETHEIPADLTAQLNEQIDETTEDIEKKAGRAKTDKSALANYLKTKIESKDFVNYEDWDEKTPLEEYLSGLPNKDLEALLEENIKRKEQSIREEAPQRVYESLPEEIQLAADYWAKGGRDIKGLLSALSQVHEIKELDPAKEDDQVSIVREYLRAKDFGTSEAIEDEIAGYKDLGKLADKAKQWKPQLDKMKEDVIQYQMEQQALVSQEMKKRADQYIQSVYEALKPGVIGDIKLDSRTQERLYRGLVEANQESISGGNTNRLGYLLEEYQYRKPNYGKIAKVLWLLEDEEGYEKALMQKGANAKTEEVSRKLKAEQGNRSTSTAIEGAGNASRANKISRKTSIFGRD